MTPPHPTLVPHLPARRGNPAIRTRGGPGSSGHRSWPHSPVCHTATGSLTVGIILGALLSGLLLVCPSTGLSAAEPPLHVVWIVVDDMSPHFGCYGEPLVDSPHIDRLAREGTRFTQAFTTAPVCSPCRSALITGCYQTTIGAHHHRSGRGAESITLPAGVTPLPALFQQADWFTALGGPLVAGTDRLGKSDYNFQWRPQIYHANDWSRRRPGQPFFMQVQLHGGKYREGNRWEERAREKLGTLTDPASVRLPPHYPDDPVLREDWARYLDACRFTDREVGEVLERLDREGLANQTLVIFTTDHGISHARGKQFLYEEGLRVPLILRGPGIPAGATRTDLVQLIDLAPTSLARAGLPIPPAMQGRDLFDPQATPRSHIFAARDRCDETVENLRCIRTPRYKYIRNGYPGWPHLQPNGYKDGKPIVVRLRELHAEGKLSPLVEQLLFSPTRAAEELYDLHVDPHELQNLAADPQLAELKAELAARLNEWQAESGDRGREPEPEVMYDSDMSVYLREAPPPRRAILERNIEQMREYRRQGL